MRRSRTERRTAQPRARSLPVDGRPPPAARARGPGLVLERRRAGAPGPRTRARPGAGRRRAPRPRRARRGPARRRPPTSLEERYRAVSGTPQLRANLEVQHPPTLAYYAGDLQRREGALLLAFVDRDGRAIASAGDADLLAAALAAPASALSAHAGKPYFVTTAELRSDAGPLGRLVAVDAVDAPLVARWSDLCGAPLAFHTPETRDELARVVASLPGLELRVAADLGAERAALRHSRENLALAGAVSLALSLLASFLFARSFVRPIRAIQHATERIRGGDFATRLESARRDEIGDVARAFDAMLDHLQASRGAGGGAPRRAHAQPRPPRQRAAPRADRQLRDRPRQRRDRGLEPAARALPPRGADKPIDAEQMISRVHPDDRQRARGGGRAGDAAGSPVVADFRIVLPDASERVIHSEGARGPRRRGPPLRLEGTAQDVTERRRAEEQIRFLAYHDGLTGLGNRRLFTERLRASIETRGGAARCSACCSSTSTTSSASTTRSATRSATSCCAASRAGSCTACARATRSGAPDGVRERDLAPRRRRVHDPGRSDRRSAGPLAGGRADPRAARAPVRAGRPRGGGRREHRHRGVAARRRRRRHAAAQRRLGDVPREGARPQPVPVLHRVDERRGAAPARVEQRLRTGLARGELEVHYQPKLDLRTQQVAGFEALVRWRDPERGLVLPGEFIPVAEQSGMIIAIGRSCWSRRAARSRAGSRTATARRASSASR